MDLAAGLPLEADRTDMRYQWISGSGEQRVRQAKLARSSGWKSRPGKA
jgi:hypothetical protein